jgi:hypothetical protein|tara:strand:- start:2156 stop:2452 length:297 start_codon:yes stop_codon:yes gene_type:complete
MIEWTIIIILVIAIVALLRVLRNVIKTLDNMRLRLTEVAIVVNNYKEHLEKLNSSETYYGDPTIEAFVGMTNDVGDTLDDILNIRRELTGEENATKEN